MLVEDEAVEMQTGVSLSISAGRPLITDNILMTDAGGAVLLALVSIGWLVCCHVFV